MTFRAYILLGCLLFAAAGCANPPTTQPVCLLDHCELDMAAPNSEPSPVQPASLLQETQLSGEHDVSFYVQAALERNPEIQAAQRRVTAQAEVIPQATALEDPMLSNSFWPIPENSPQTASGRMPYSVMVSQRFPWFGKLCLRGQVAEQETRIALTQLAETQLSVIEQVKASYYELSFNQRAINITLESERLLHDVIQFAETRYRTGQTSQQDVLRAQVELNHLQDQLIQLRQQLDVSQADMAALLHISPETDLEAAGDFELPSVPSEIEQLYQVAVASRPELQGRLEAIVRDRTKVDLAKLEYYPDITAGVGWDWMTGHGALSPVADSTDNVGFNVSISLPIWRDRLRGGVREAQERAAESARMYDLARDDTFKRIRRLVVQARALEQQITLFRDDIVPKADQTLRVSSADYQVGKVDFLQLIDNWIALLRYQIQLARLESMLGQTLASLERVVGGELLADGMHTPAF